MSKVRGEKMNLFNGGDDLESVANDIYGGSSEIPDSGRVVARPTPIMSIHADVKQPRRAIPLSIRMHWDGNPLEVVDLLGQWHLVSEKQAGMTFDVVRLLNGEGEGIDSDKFPSVASEYLSLVRLAQGIKADGLINPITVIESDGKLLIESGERRWLAYHLLNTYLGEQWAKIPAAKGNTNDSVWRQATENTQRRALNPIGMARQLALLIMAARGTPPMAEGSLYKEYEEIVTAGTSDRRFYAQVADGNVHRIPKGMGERIQSAMGLSMEQLSRYRALLRMTDDELVNDVLWTRADVENWAEGAIREAYTLPIGKVRNVIERSVWSIDDLRALKEVATPTLTLPQNTGEGISIPRRPVTSEWMNKRVITKGSQIGTVVDVDGDLIKVVMPNGQRQLFNYQELTLTGGQVGAAPNSSNPMPSSYTFAIGDWVRTRTGSEGEVVAVAGRSIGVRTKNGVLTQHSDNLIKIEQKKEQPVIEDAPFIVGNQVITRFGRVLIVRGFSSDGLLTLVNSVPNEKWWSVATADLKLYEEPVIDEDTIEEDVDPEAPVQERAWREGGPEEGHNNEADQSSSDKADSVEPTLIIAVGSDERNFLFQLEAIARLTQDQDAVYLLGQLLWMKDAEAIALANSQTLKTTLDDAYKTMTGAMEGWLTVTFASILQQIEKTAAQ